jgi:hypothetical protein
MVNRGQGNQWHLGREPREEIDFDYEYPILAIPQPEKVTIYLKQAQRRVKISDAWTSLSDRLVQE